MLLRRNPRLVVGFSSTGWRIRDPRTGSELADAAALDLLARFERPGSVRAVLSGFSGSARRLAHEAIDALVSAGFLLPSPPVRRREARAADLWTGGFAAAQYHAACRDTPYLTSPAELKRRYRAIVRAAPRPPAFKSYRGAPARSLPKGPPGGDAEALGRVLLARRTVREFRRAAVPLSDLAQLLRLTFGLTGMFVTELGPLASRTSPSGGALHPIEAYLLAWNVESLAPGLYHYDVLDDELRRLRRGDFRRTAIELASGQKWIGRAAFLCVLTAAFPRVLWKYPFEDSYRTLFLDAGHLAQTFCLVATSLGLGPFTTAAIQDSKIEKLLAIDGVHEFPVYLCGAGVPAARSARAKTREAR